MQSKHTAGNWIVANSGGTIIYHNGIRYEKICELEKKPLKITPEVEANARLIAAAPTLLSLLIQAKEYLEMREDFLIEDAEEGEENLYTQMKTAIQKATQP